MALSIRKVNADVVPQSGHRGRTRAHNDFDEYMNVYNAADHTDSEGNVEWDGWNAVDFQSDEELAKLSGQLTGASNHANVGISKRVDNMARVLYFRVNVRTLKPRQPKGTGNGTSEGTNARLGTVAHTVNELQEVVDADSPKRERKAS